MPNEDGTPTPEEQAAELEAANAAAQAAMTAEERVALPDDRPAVNVLAEMRRRDEKTQRELAELRTMLAQMAQQSAVQRPAPAATEYTDDQLRQLAEQGNMQAQTMLAERAGARVAQQSAQAQQVFAQAQQRVLGLVTQYPALRDANHPLAQEALRRKQGLLSQGAYNGLDPNLANLLATVQAIQDTCTDHPDLAVQGRQAPGGLPDAAELSRRSAVAAQTGVDGGGPPRRPARPGTPATGPTYKFTAQELAIAQRMGVDPQKARANFAKRNEAGRSAVTPSVEHIVTQQGGQL